MTASSQRNKETEPDPTAGCVFIVWHPYSRRAQLLSKKLGLQLRLVHTLKRRYYLAPLRYVLQAVRTWRYLWVERPRLVFVQSPPIFAALIVYLYSRVARTQYVIDAHTGALLAPWWRWSLPLHAFLSRRALTTIVTNQHLYQVVAGWDAASFIVADIPMVFPPSQRLALEGGFRLAVINTFSPDEPLEAVLEAAAALVDVQFYITGDPIRAKRSVLDRRLPNARFTGFLPDPDYFGLLRSMDGILVLTTDDHTMQRGACEAVSLGVPIITSNWPLLREYFHKGTIHVDNTPDGIRQGVRRLQAEKAQLMGEIGALQEERRLEWQQKYAALVALIAKGSGAPASVEQGAG
jgi:glycosyltransferase involved in cell wall biosynthesis